MIQTAICVQSMSFPFTIEIHKTAAAQGIPRFCDMAHKSCSVDKCNTQGKIWRQLEREVCNHCHELEHIKLWKWKLVASKLCNLEVFFFKRIKLGTLFFFCVLKVKDIIYL